MFDDDARPYIAARPGSRKGKRAKTFTGCWTCRSRKVKCDLRRPNCTRCEKSNLECGGYDIKLRWSNPVKFDACGVQLPTTLMGGVNDEPQYRRRNIDYVRYREEYEFHEDMDDELSALHKPPPQRISNGKTWIIKKFGVFRALESPADTHNHKRRHLNAESDTHKLDEQAIPDEADDSEKPLYMFDRNAFHTNFPYMNQWISDELKEDALISASALEDFSIIGLPFPSESGATTTPLEEEHCSIFNREANMSPVPNQKDDQTLQQVLQVLFNKSEHTDCIEAHSNEQIEDTEPSRVMSKDQKRMEFPPLDGSFSKIAVEVTESPGSSSNVFSFQHSKNPLLRLPTTGLHVHGLTRFLLSYYIQNVADLMTVVALKTNPWKSLYFPRALQAMGDLASLGCTSNSRNSVLNALLAVACFNLNSKLERKSPEAQFFLNHGIEFRKQASFFLKVCMKDTVHNEKYKDVLTAILSMNSIDVVWGSMVDCQYHLTVCENFIETRMKERPKISEKAKTLHRLFSFLKLIQDSTALDKVNDKEITITNSDDDDTSNSGNDDSTSTENVLPPNYKEVKANSGCCRIYTEVLDESSGKIKMKYLQEAGYDNSMLGNRAPRFYSSESGSSNETLRHFKSNELHMDDLYGLPKSLISLFFDCVSLARHKEYYKKKHISPPVKFEGFCSEVEQKLLHWDSEWSFWNGRQTRFINDTIEGVYHHTMSFYYSLLIYFFTMVRGMDYQHYQQYVKRVLHHLEALDLLVETKSVKIVPLIWQGFIAGCNSIDTKVQAAFRSWTAKLGTSGMGSYWGARQVMLEVWRRRANKLPGDDWFTVYKEWGMNLMLS